MRQPASGLRLTAAPACAAGIVLTVLLANGGGPAQVEVANVLVTNDPCGGVKACSQ
jgi:hypothetical protein